MWIRWRFWLALCCCGLLCLGGCAPARHVSGFGGVALEPGRYLQKYYRSPNFDPAAAVYQVEIFPVEQVRGLGPEQARVLFNEELLKAMTANGLKVSQAGLAGSPAKLEAQTEGSKTDRTKPEVSLIKPKNPEKSAPLVTLSGVVEGFEVAAPLWRFFSGKGHVDLQVSGAIHRGTEVVFAFHDEVVINPPVNPRHRPTLEPDLMARLAVRRFTANLLNELLLPPTYESGKAIPPVLPPNP